MSLPWRNPNLTLGQRCVEFMKAELAAGVAEDAPRSYTSPRIREYFKICTRRINGIERSIGLTKGNWCAAAVSFSLHQSLLPTEKAPHGFRVGVIEIIEETKANHSYRPVELIRLGKFIPQAGDLVFFDRSNPNDPSTSWFRHIGRYIEETSNGFLMIDGNHGGKYNLTKVSYNQKNLLGFAEYPSAVAGTDLNISSLPAKEDISHLSEKELAPEFDSGSALTGFWEQLNLFMSK